MEFRAAHDALLGEITCCASMFARYRRVQPAPAPRAEMDRDCGDAEARHVSIKQNTSKFASLTLIKEIK